MFVIWQGINVETKFYNSTVRLSMPELHIITYQIEKMDGFTICGLHDLSEGK